MRFAIALALVLGACSERVYTPATPTIDPAVARCAEIHGLAATNRVYATVSDSRGRHFAECRDPRPAYANVDGYIDITVSIAEGPGGGGEAGGITYADRVSAPCPTVEFLYSFTSQGAVSRLPLFRAHADDVVTVDGHLWPGDRARLAFYPARGEIVVLHNNKNTIDSARCV